MIGQREFAVEVIRKLRSKGFTALFAGGCVRDLLLGRDAKDYDVATTARPEQVRDLFGHRKTLPVGASFGVIIVLGPREVGPVEVATFRTEGPYHDGRRPASVSYSTPEQDAQRRDFTINGMFYDPVEARVMDFVGGEADLSARVVRAIGDPHARMSEDKLRMLRAVRFTATLDFTLDPATSAAIRQMADQLTVVSAERISQELKKMLVDSHRRRAIELCDEVGLRSIILPELADRTDGYEATLRSLSLLEDPSFELAMAVLLHTIADERKVHEICRRLKLSNDETNRITWLVAHQDDLLRSPTLPLAPLKRILAHPYRDDLIALLRVKLLAAEADLRPAMFCVEYLSRTPESTINPPPLLTGDVLKSLGLQPGPAFRTILEAIRDAQLSDQISTLEEATALAISMTHSAPEPE